MQKGGSMERARFNTFFRTGIISISLLLGIYSIRSIQCCLFKNIPITVRHNDTVHARYAQELNNNIIAMIHSYGPTITTQHCKDHFPILSHLAIRYTFPLHASVDYTIASPDTCLNKSVSLLPNGIIVSRDLFSQDLLTIIPHITIPISVLCAAELPKTLKSYAKNNLHDTLERFSCTWQNDYTCFYHDQKNTEYTLLYQGYAPPSVQDIALYDRVITQYKPNNKHTSWLVDLRFKNQVVISPDQGM